MPGPPRKPSAIKLVEGTYRKDRALEAEVHFKEGVPPCPEHLGPTAKAEWRRVTAELSKIPGLLQVVDRAVLAAYCSVWGEYVYCSEQLIELGSLIYQGGNLARVHPLVAIRREAMRQLHEFAQAFGFTPAARARVPTPKGVGDGEGKLAKYLADKYLS
jgi:P27 family predicted phage terminase small subunit